MKDGRKIRNSGEWRLQRMETVIFLVLSFLSIKLYSYRRVYRLVFPFFKNNKTDLDLDDLDLLFKVICRFGHSKIL